MKKALLGSSLMVLAALATAQGKLTDVQWTKGSNGLKVEVSGENLTQPKIIRAMGGKSYMLEFSAHLMGKAKREVVNTAGVDYVHTVWFTAKPPKVRVHVKLNDPLADVRLAKSAGGWTVSVAQAVSAASKAAAKSDSDAALWELPKLVPLKKPETDDTKSATTGPKSASDDPASTIGKIELPGETTVASLLGPKPLADGDPYEKKQTPKTAPKAAPKPLRIHEPAKTTPLPTGGTQRQRTVTLDMVNADVVQILKALAMQAGVNIVTSPEVKGTLTVSLTNVSVEEALNLVTTLAGVKYAKSGSTYVVAASAERLKSFPKIEDGAETRVVPIYSGEGTQIKAAVLKVVPMDGSRGSFEVVLPSEEISVEQTSAVGASGGDAKTGGATGETTTVEQRTGAKGAKDSYLVLIGPKSQLDILEKTVKTIDAQICGALGIDVPTSSAIVRSVYNPRGTSAVQLLQTVAGSKYDKSSPYSAKVGSVEIIATPERTIGEQTLTMRGREHEVADLILTLQALDSVAGGEGEYVLYEVKYLDPRAVRDDLINQFPGLQVTILPGAVANPGLTPDAGQQAAQAANGQGANAGAGAAGVVGQQGGQTGGSGELLEPDKGEVAGIALPFRKFEPFAYPMKIMLRGSKSKIEGAKQYLQTIDVAPKQVAIELRVMDLRKEDAQKVGLDWNILTGGTVRTIRVNQGVGGSAGAPGNISGSLGFAGGAVANILGTLDDIANDTNLIARPNLMGVDGRQSEIFVGDIIRYIESIQASQNGTTITSKELPVGVRLAILPRIGGDGQITLDLRPVVSTLTGFTTVPGGGNLPQTSLRVAQSTMSIKSGETIAIGGLIQDSDTITNSGIPILKDLPIIGKLFSRSEKTKRRSEIVLFLTARVVDENRKGDEAQPKREDPKRIGG
jgi:type II secretory pathway component GspD/PulD (secretin)